MRGYIHTAELIRISLFPINHIAVICFSPGLIVDMAGDYRAGFYMAGATLVLSAGFLVILDRLQQRKKRGSKIRTKPEKSTKQKPKPKTPLTDQEKQDLCEPSKDKSTMLL